MNAQAPSAFDPSPREIAPRSAIDAWRRRSRLIGLWRTALPIIVGLVVLGVVGQLVFRGVVSAVQQNEEEAVSEIRIVNPRFLGRDQRGRAFVLEATDAVRDPRNPQIIRLRQPRLTLQGNGRPLRVRSLSGIWRESDEVAVMVGQVVVTDQRDGSVFRAEELIASTRTDVMWGRLPVTAVGPDSRVSAQSYAIYDQGERIVLRGQVRAHLNNGFRGGGGPSLGAR